MTFFKAEDFITNSSAPQTPHSVAKLANQKLQKEAEVVYGNAAGMIFNQELLPGDTHKALLLCIEPLVKPKCEHKYVQPVNCGEYYRCTECQEKLLATWRGLND